LMSDKLQFVDAPLALGVREGRGEGIGEGIAEQCKN